MKHNTPIHNLDSLDREIDRLQAELQETEKELAAQWQYLRSHGSSFFTPAWWKQPGSREKNEMHDGRLFSSEKLNHVVDTIIGRLTDRAAEKAEHWLDRIFGKKKHPG